MTTLNPQPKNRDVLPTFKQISNRNFSQGTVREIQSSIAPIGTFKIALNMDSDEEVGSLVSRPGLTVAGSQVSATYSCFGIGNFAKTELSANKILLENSNNFLLEDGNFILTENAGKKLFGVFQTVSDNTIFDILDGEFNLTGDTAGSVTRFCSFLDELVRVNGVDAPKSYNGVWITTGGAFDLANMPVFNTVIEWKDRIYGALSNSDILSFSSVADPIAKTISWTDATPVTGKGYIAISQEDGGGGIQGLEKVPGYLLIFKRRTMKRWDGTSTYPEDLINQGVQSQECICRGRENVYFINQEGVWITNGNYPVRISRQVQDFIEAISDWSKVTSVGDDVHLHFSIGTVTVKNITYNNCMLRYAIEDKTWDIRSYQVNITAMGRFTNTLLENYMMIGDNNGHVMYLDIGLDDNGEDIQWTVEPHQLDFGMRGNIKNIERMFVYTQNVSNGKVYWKNKQDDSNYRQLGSLDRDVNDFNNIGDFVKGNYIDLKFIGSTDGEQVKFLGYDFPNGSVIVNQNASE